MAYFNFSDPFECCPFVPNPHRVETIERKQQGLQLLRCGRMVYLNGKVSLLAYK